MDRLDLERRLDALASLAEPVRLALYWCVAGREQGLGRDEAAAAVGISRKLAAYHLDKLAEAGLLEVRFERRGGRSGPGAGRPAKIYLRSARWRSPCQPETTSSSPSCSPTRCRRTPRAPRAPRSSGRPAPPAPRTPSTRTRAMGGRVTLPACTRCWPGTGYEAYDDEGVTRLRNCPFERLAQTHRAAGSPSIRPMPWSVAASGSTAPGR
jgi:DNA-binding transcriptional ArsR family regulator